MTPIERPSPNHSARPAGIPTDMLILHYTGMRTAAEALDRMRDPAAKVSAHYMIEENGAVYRLVDETRRAWHAGVSYWAGERNVNGRSIGVELVNPGHEFGYRPFPDAQMAALLDLAADILRRHSIPARYVLGHSDVAPARKRDPGELFDWPRLAAAGIGLWPEAAQDLAADDFTAGLARYGYEAEADGVVAAFQRHFRPERVDGVIDAETRTRLAGLLSQIS